MTLLIGISILLDKKASKDGKTAAFLACVAIDVLIIAALMNKI